MGYAAPVERLKSVNWSDRNVLAKERLSRVDLETILRIGDYCNALCEEYEWKTCHTAAEWLLLEHAMQIARRKP